MQAHASKSDYTSLQASKKNLDVLFNQNNYVNIGAETYDLFFETTPIKVGPNQSDFAIMHKRLGWCSLNIAAFFKADKINDVLIIVRECMDKNSLLDFFVFNPETESYYNIKKHESGYDISFYES